MPETPRRPLFESARAAGASGLVHLIVLLALASIVLTRPADRRPPGIRTSFVPRPPEPVLVPEVMTPEAEAGIGESAESAAQPLPIPSAGLSTLASVQATPPRAAGLKIPGGGAVAGMLRTRASAVAKYGGSAESEAAVEAALDWLDRHQAADGSWCFDHTADAGCDCGRPGTSKGRTGATGAALLAYLGAGHTHADGPRAESVRRGIKYLLENQSRRPDGSADFRGGDGGIGGIYQHGLATAAVAEALAANRALMRYLGRRDAEPLKPAGGRPPSIEELKELNERLARSAELAVAYTLLHRDEAGGGWGYQVDQPGDTSILGWQVQSLVTARSEGVPVPADVWRGAARFLDAAYTRPGYAYKPGDRPKPSMTAVGAACRILADGGYSRRRLGLTIDELADRGPKPGDMYYTYYATQALFAWGDEEGGRAYWSDWNAACRDRLVSRQAASGHAAGSWQLGGDKRGGRFFDTCLATMTLEVYYRKLSAYKKLTGAVR